MRPVSVRFQCFGPYMQEQYVSFEDLEKNGIFLICGETGAGKTTILDAICYALYGRSSGGLRGGLEVMRCALAGSEDDTLVEFIFDSGGRRYRFTRTLKFKTEKNKKSRNLNDYHSCVELDGDREIPIVEKEQDRYVTAKAQELIGLTYDQFRQVIILPQGQFERLLVSDSEQKEEILVSLFHAQRWQKIAEEIHNRVSEEDKQLKEERRNIEQQLQQYGCRNLGELAQKNEEQCIRLAQLREQTQHAEQALETAKQAKESALLENQAFQELKRRQLRLASLKGQEDTFASEKTVLADADSAEAIRPQYRAWQQAADAAAQAADTVQKAEQSLETKIQALESVCQKQMRHEAQRAEMAEHRQYIALLCSAESAYAALESRKAAADAARLQQNAAHIAYDKAHILFVKSSDALQLAIETQNAAMQRYQTAQEQYLLGIGATLAQSLEPGKPCPVCGSREHPQPARQEQISVTEAQLNEALAQMNDAGQQVSRCLAQRTQTEQAKQKAEQALVDAQRRADIADTAYREALSQRLEGIETELQRLARLKELEQKVARFEETDRQLQLQLTNAMGGEAAARDLLAAAQNARKQADAVWEEKTQQWNCALEESGLHSLERFLAADMEHGEKQRRSEALLRFRTELAGAQEALAEQSAALAGKMAPDLEKITLELTEAENHHRSCVTAQTLEDKQLEDMTRARGNLTARLEAHDEKRLAVDADLVYAKRLRGDSGISLQRYVLGVMMTSVTVEANRLLSSVYRGRYRLFRTDEVSGRKRKGGLELEVYDSHTNQRRSVTTLSGGEKFLVSLSLAIGLSTVVQAQGGGIRLEAMFIDEGFGSLDRESVSDALEVLQGVRRGSGIVGIISHVEQLAEVIPTRLEITKGKNGSVCHLRG